MKKAIGAAMMMAGFFLGLYVGVWVCFIGGIVDVIGQIKADDLSAMIVAIGIAKIFLAALAGWVSAFVVALPGYAIFES